ncbi:MAG: excinuclease ABC subunit UvrA [Nitrococcus sp.]|nr:excinuclease ABC subunit UvrA [Nitrococcus sp.]
MSSDHIRIRGARQNNLRNLDLDLPLGELMVITGVSGSGKSSLAFDTVYAEGQRRYVETFSPYARQFLDRMDKPAAERIDGIPPSIAIDQTNPVRTSRSTVGTMTELNDHLKLLYARAAALYCQHCGERVARDSADGVFERLIERGKSRRVVITFAVEIPASFTQEEIRELLTRQGYTRLHSANDQRLEVIQDRLRLEPERRDRIIEALEAALKHGRGRVNVYPLDDSRQVQDRWRFSTDLHCADCDLHYTEAQPNLFSFNSPIGACATCRGFGRRMGIDYALVIPDAGRSLANGVIRPWRSGQSAECQRDLMRFARERGVPTDIPWRNLPESDRRWILDGEGSAAEDLWYGVRGYFDWLESKSYKMHVRVLLSKYRSYDFCPACGGARLKLQALLWRLGSREDADTVLDPANRFRPVGASFAPKCLGNLPGLNIHDLMGLPIERAARFFERVQLAPPLDEGAELLLEGIRSRLHYLSEVGLGYLTLDRQSRTLSGGEVQRINLTTALGTSLVNTLFVLDEPSIGLHPRDMQRIIEVMRRLRDAGNSLLVVEHDPQVMFAADRILDLGPGPGEGGGEIVFFGPPAQLPRASGSLTADYVSGRRTIASTEVQRPRGPPEAWLEIHGAAEHNLRALDVRIPLQQLVVLTGVSGSGKSTLMQDVLYKGLRKLKGRSADRPGQFTALHGHEPIEDVELVDQSPIGKTTRSNPASYIGVFAAIRKVFAAEPLAKERGYRPGSFSFNSGNGRCPTCGGNGFERVEMQFLSDVYLRCADCDGRRYRGEVLEVKLTPAASCQAAAKSVVDVLAMTVTEATAFFAGYADIIAALAPLEAVGLGYLQLGQPVPTLSGGEAQRLKLAGHLTGAARRQGQGKRLLFLFDEPTTGLHFADIAVLLRAFDRLLQAGHTLVVIEHNLDVIAAADWIIDLGPEGGDRGGEIVCMGTPAQVMAVEASHTGQALWDYTEALTATRSRKHNSGSESGADANSSGDSGPSWERRPRRDLVQPQNHRGEAPHPHLSQPPACAREVPSAYLEPGTIHVHHAREHNLKNIDVYVPRERLTVITGISGSGKSTLAFDILFNEGQRRYLESLNAYARQFVQPAARPDVDAIFGIPPTVAIGQRTSRGGRKSTVATQTELYHFLRLLFVKLGAQHCPDCDRPIEAQTVGAIVARLLREHRGRRARLLAPLVLARKGYYTDLAKWAAGKGFTHLRVDRSLLATADWPRLERYREHDIDLPVAELTLAPENEAELREQLQRALDYGKGRVRVDLGDPDEALFSIQRACPRCGRSFQEPDPRQLSFNSPHGWCPSCYGAGVVLPGVDPLQSAEEAEWAVAEAGAEPRTCPDCEGRRLRREALAIRFRDRNIADYTALTVDAATRVFAELELDARESAIARDLLPELRHRLTFLREVGLGYLTLDRAAPTLSGGEAQRIRLAAQLGSNLRGVCYILDEPTIGLHPRDNRRLLDSLQQLGEKGNTVVVVEHDEETIRRAEHVIDLGPGAGAHGGYVVAAGTPAELEQNPRSLTGRLLAEPLRHPLLAGDHQKPPPRQNIYLLGAYRHNLREVDVRLPLGRLVGVSGVSGSGKSTLIRDVLHGNLHRLLAAKRSRSRPPLRGCKDIIGWGAVDRVLEVDQSPIGKTPRSCPATYVGFWDDVRRLFAQTEQARIRGYGPGRFSFNTKEGRCPACEGQGVKRIAMSFLPDVTLRCEVCNGLRFTPETLAVGYAGKSIGDVLQMSVDEAVQFFAVHAKVQHALRLLQDTGLGYLTLGQQSPTLSGGEAQRLKLVTELSKARPSDRQRRPPHTLYLLDEPTVGLHMADVERLIRVLHRLVSAGNTVVVIEHNLDVLAEADWLLDLGPEGGEDGGRIVAEGTPEAVAQVREGSYTARILEGFLAERGSVPQQSSSQCTFASRSAADL